MKKFFDSTTINILILVGYVIFTTFVDITNPYIKSIITIIMMCYVFSLLVLTFKKHKV